MKTYLYESHGFYKVMMLYKKKDYFFKKSKIVSVQNKTDIYFLKDIDYKIIINK